MCSAGIDIAAVPEAGIVCRQPRCGRSTALRAAVVRPHVDIDLARLSANGYVTPQCAAVAARRGIPRHQAAAAGQRPGQVRRRPCLIPIASW